MIGKIERKVFGRQQQERIVAGTDRKDVGQAVTVNILDRQGQGKFVASSVRRNFW